MAVVVIFPLLLGYSIIMFVDIDGIEVRIFGIRRQHFITTSNVTGSVIKVSMERHHLELPKACFIDQCISDLSTVQ